MGDVDAEIEEAQRSRGKGLAVAVESACPPPSKSCSPWQKPSLSRVNREIDFGSGAHSVSLSRCRTALTSFLPSFPHFDSPGAFGGSPRHCALSIDFFKVKCPLFLSN